MPQKLDKTLEAFYKKLFADVLFVDIHCFFVM